MRDLIFSALLGLVCNGCAAIGDGLDNSTWKVRVGGLTGYLLVKYDHISFKEGKFISNHLVKHHGYVPAPYSVRRMPDGIHWSAVLKGPDGSQVAWERVFTRDHMKGNYTWSLGEETKSWTFSAKRVGPSGRSWTMWFF